jgi:hypothetical protein
MTVQLDGSGRAQSREASRITGILRLWARNRHYVPGMCEREKSIT